MLAKNDVGLLSVAVEGKVDEAFDKPLGERKAEASSGKETRLTYLTKTLALAAPVPDSIRYQLLHRAASAVIEAERFGARHAVILIHSFSRENAWFQDFAAFADLFGLKPEIDDLVSTTARKGLPLHLVRADSIIEGRLDRQNEGLGWG